jgi:hypothetical protein
LLIDVQARGKHKQRILVQIAVDNVKISDEKFNWLLIAVQASREHKQRILVQIALGDIKFRDEQFN